MDRAIIWFKCRNARTPSWGRIKVERLAGLGERAFWAESLSPIFEDTRERSGRQPEQFVKGRAFDGLAYARAGGDARDAQPSEDRYVRASMRVGQA